MSAHRRSARARPVKGARRHLRRAVQLPGYVFGVTARLIAVGVIVATPTAIVAAHASIHRTGARPQAAVLTGSPVMTGSVLAWPAGSVPLTAGSTSPPPAAAVNLPGPLNIPGTALAAYRNADGMMAREVPGCAISWNLLAGIGRIESRHANDGATDARGTAIKPIYGPALDGSLPGNEVIQSRTADGATVYARAMGPMQFLPGTWTHYAADGNNDGQADPQNLFDAALAAARYLCSDGSNLRDPAQTIKAVLRYNNSMAYVENVLGWATAYVTGVAPVNLPAITGPIPPFGGVRAASGPASTAPPPSREPPPEIFAETRDVPGDTEGQPGPGSTSPPASRAAPSPAGLGSSGGDLGGDSVRGAPSPRVTVGDGRNGSNHGIGR